MTHRETAAEIGIPWQTLCKYRRQHPEYAPKNWDDVEGWRTFVGNVKSYSSDQSQLNGVKRPRGRPTKRPAPTSDVLPPDEQRYDPGKPIDPNDDFYVFNAVAERKERILRLRLANEEKRQELLLLERATVPIKEAISTLAVIAATQRGEILEIPGAVAEPLAGKDAAFIQTYLETILRKVLDRLSWPETFLKPKAKGF